MYVSTDQQTRCERKGFDQKPQELTKVPDIRTKNPTNLTEPIGK